MQNIYSCISKNSRCNVVDQRTEEERRASQEVAAAQSAQQEALVRLQEEQRQRQERGEQQERLAKLAPWAKKETSAPASSGEQLTLAEIQRRAAERDRAERAAQEVVEA